MAVSDTLQPWSSYTTMYTAAQGSKYTIALGTRTCKLVKRPKQLYMAWSAKWAYWWIGYCGLQMPLLPLDCEHWPEQQVSVIGPHGCMCWWLACELQYCCTVSDMLSYWWEQYKWTVTTVNLIDFLATAKLLAQLSLDQLWWVQKLQCGWLLVNQMVSWYDPDQPNSCTTCSPGVFVEETVDHIFPCESSARQLAIHEKFSSIYHAFGQ